MENRFLCLEGLDGCGKTTQLERLHKYLGDLNQEVVRVREPGGTTLGEGLRQLLLSPDQPPVTSISELLMFFAARAQLVEEVIRPALRAGKWVLADRFVWSTFAYQGYGRGLSLEVIEKLANLACGTTLPLLTLVLSLPNDERLSRLQKGRKQSDRLEQQNDEFFSRVSLGFTELAEQHPTTIKIVDACGSEEDVWTKVKMQFSAIYKEFSPT